MGWPALNASSLVIRLLDEDPALGEELDPESFAAAERIAVRGFVTSAEGRQIDEVDVEPGLLGLLILDGLIVRRVRVGRGICSEVLGRDDLVRPWQPEQPDVSSIQIASSWTVLEPARVAVLDRRFALTVARWPEITSSLLARMAARNRRFSFFCAVTSLPRMDSRLLLVLWYFADRWGRMTTAGAHVPLRLSHEVLAEIVGARRPSVSVALGRLRKRGAVVRLPDRSWLLPGPPPIELSELRDFAAA